VGRPDVILLVDPHRMSEGPGIEILADLADEAAVTIELENLRSRGAEGVGNSAAARIDVDVALGVHRHTRCLAQMHVRRQLDKIRSGAEFELGGRCRRREGGWAQQHEKPGKQSFHDTLPCMAGPAVLWLDAGYAPPMISVYKRAPLQHNR